MHCIGIPSKAKAVDVFLSGFLLLRAAAMSNWLSLLSSSFFCDFPNDNGKISREI